MCELLDGDSSESILRMNIGERDLKIGSPGEKKKLFSYLEVLRSGCHYFGVFMGLWCTYGAKPIDRQASLLSSRIRVSKSIDFFQ